MLMYVTNTELLNYLALTVMKHADGQVCSHYMSALCRHYFVEKTHRNDNTG
jgi:hypothetical protein